MIRWGGKSKKSSTGLEIVAKYQIETEYMAMKSARMKFMILTAKEARCPADALGTCTSSPIYFMGNYKHLCASYLKAIR